ncbi:MAG: FHA domain-containing protein [Micromonosporaceae bacterium]
MRFTVSQALDTIEQRLTTDPLLASAIVDLASVVRHTGLDDGRPAHLLRLGMVIDALVQRTSDHSSAVYPVADRGLLSDLELTSNEKMVIRRWGDDGLAEVVPELEDRVLEVAELTGLPVISRDGYAPYQERYGAVLQRRLTPMPGAGGVVLSGNPSGMAGSVAGAPAFPMATPQNPVLRRLWQCPERGCSSFGEASLQAAAGGAHDGGQPPPRLRQGEPMCPRHGQRLADVGAASPALGMLAVIQGAARRRFVVRAGSVTVVGRNPEAPGVRLGEWLDDEALKLVSRAHLQLELLPEGLGVVDTSTNGSVVVRRSAADAPPQRVELARGRPLVLTEWDSVELHTGVEVVNAKHWRPAGPADVVSTVSEAPTMAFRVPPQA